MNSRAGWGGRKKGQYLAPRGGSFYQHPGAEALLQVEQQVLGPGALINDPDQLHLGPGAPFNRLSPAEGLLAVSCPLGSSCLLLHPDRRTWYILYPFQSTFEEQAATGQRGMNGTGKGALGVESPGEEEGQFPFQLLQRTSCYGEPSCVSQSTAHRWVASHCESTVPGLRLLFHIFVLGWNCCILNKLQGRAERNRSLIYSLSPMWSYQRVKLAGESEREGRQQNQHLPSMKH